MGDVSAFMIKGYARAFMMGDRMGDVHAFVIKGDAQLETRVSFTCIIEEAQYEHASPFHRRSGRVSDINLTGTHQKEDHLLFTLHQASSAPR
jgi:hypothetical protein